MSAVPSTPLAEPERWLRIPGYGKRYAVSTHLRVKRLRPRVRILPGAQIVTLLTNDHRYRARVRVSDLLLSALAEEEKQAKALRFAINKEISLLQPPPPPDDTAARRAIEIARARYGRREP